MFSGVNADNIYVAAYPNKIFYWNREEQSWISLDLQITVFLKEIFLYYYIVVVAYYLHHSPSSKERSIRHHLFHGNFFNRAL